MNCQTSSVHRIVIEDEIHPNRPPLHFPFNAETNLTRFNSGKNVFNAAVPPDFIGSGLNLPAKSL
jgi:hypothetical protein